MRHRRAGFSLPVYHSTPRYNHVTVVFVLHRHAGSLTLSHRAYMVEYIETSSERFREFRWGRGRVGPLVIIMCLVISFAYNRWFYSSRVESAI